jgi:hypothetical protein
MVEETVSLFAAKPLTLSNHGLKGESKIQWSPRSDEESAATGVSKRSVMSEPLVA